MTTLLYKAGTKDTEFGIKCEIIRVRNPKEIADWIATGTVFFHPSDCYAKEPESADDEPKKRGRPKAN